MHLFLEYTILGLVTGAVYGIAASGLVLTYTTSGIFNFAQGAMAMLAAFTYWQFRYGWNWPAPLALIAVIAVLAPLLGAGLYAGIMRGLRETADVTKIVVTIGIVLGLIALAQWIWNPGVPRNDLPFFGIAAKFKFLGVYVTDHEAIALACGVLIAVGIRLLFTSTRTGVAMRAVVDNPALLQLNGGRPVRLAAISWALGGALAALAGILITPISGGTLDVHVLTLLVLDSIAAAMFGRLRSIWLTFAGALVLGLTTTYVLAYFPSSWSWASDFRIALPMITLFVVLLVLPQDRLRGATLLRTRERFTVPTMRSAVTWGLILVLAVLALEEIMGTSDMGTLTVGITYAIIALSLTLLTGYAGEINLAPVSFGAIATIIVFHLGLSGTGLDQRITIWGLFLGVVVTALVGGLIALPALRLRGLYLALATLAFGVFVSDMILNDIAPHILPIFHVHFSIFPNGALQIPPLKLGPIDLSSAKTFLTTSVVHLRPHRHRPGGPAPQPLRPAPDRHEGQPGGGGHPGTEPGQAQAVGVHALGGHRRHRGRPALRRLRQRQLDDVHHLHQPRPGHADGGGRHRQRRRRPHGRDPGRLRLPGPEHHVHEPQHGPRRRGLLERRWPTWPSWRRPWWASAWAATRAAPCRRSSRTTARCGG